MVVLSCDALTCAQKLYIPVYILPSLMSVLHSRGSAAELINLESLWRWVAGLQLVFVYTGLKSHLGKSAAMFPCGQRKLLCSWRHLHTYSQSLTYNDTCRWAHIFRSSFERRVMGSSWCDLTACGLLSSHGRRRSTRSSILLMQDWPPVAIQRWYQLCCWDLLPSQVHNWPLSGLQCLMLRQTRWCVFCCDLVFLYRHWSMNAD